MNSNPANTSDPENSPSINTPSENSALSSVEQNESPLLSLPPGASLLAPSKPLVEMSDEELKAWHSRLRDHKNYQTMQAHLAAVGTTLVAKSAKASKPKVDISEFV